MIEGIMWGVSIVSLVGVVLNIYHRRECFYIWTLTNGAWTIYDLYREVYPQAALMACYFILALWGIREWRKKPASISEKRNCAEEGKEV